MNNELKFLNALALFPKFGARRLKIISNYFSLLETVFKLSFNELKNLGIEEKIILEFLEFRKKIDIEKEWEKLEKEGVKILTLEDENYPALLKEIYDPPFLLYYKGEIKKEEISLAIVGTRRISSYGKQITPQITKDFASNGITIVSGLAFGVDTLAHQSTLEVNGRTIAVLGTGLDERSLYPKQNISLARKIVEKGSCLISEFPLGTPGHPENFPLRNRIISGLSLGTLVIEAPLESGALITARSALEQNREVFAIPGSIYSPNSLGCNNLIKMGAKLVTSSLDIFDALNLKVSLPERKIVPESKEEEILLKHLSREPIYIDELIKLSNLPAPIVSSILTMMEIKGKIRNLGGMRYILT